MREQKQKIVLYFRRDSQWSGKMPNGSGFGNRSSSGDGITRRHSLRLACFFFGSDLGEQLWDKSIEVDNRQRQTDWRFFFREKELARRVYKSTANCTNRYITQHLSQSKNQNQPPPQPDSQTFHITLYTLSAASPFSYPAKSSHHQQ